MAIMENIKKEINKMNINKDTKSAIFRLLKMAVLSVNDKNSPLYPALSNLSQAEINELCEIYHNLLHESDDYFIRWSNGDIHNKDNKDNEKIEMPNKKITIKDVKEEIDKMNINEDTKYAIITLIEIMINSSSNKEQTLNDLYVKLIEYNLLNFLFDKTPSKQHNSGTWF